MHNLASGAWFSREQLYMVGQTLRDALMDSPQCYTCLPKKAELASILERYKCPPPLYQTGHPPPATPQFQPPTYQINSKVQIGNGWKAPMTEDEEVLVETEDQQPGEQVLEVTQTPGIAEAEVHIEKEVPTTTAAPTSTTPTATVTSSTMNLMEDESMTPPPEKRSKGSGGKTAGGKKQ